MAGTDGRWVERIGFLKPYFMKLLYFAFILSFVLPYVDVRGCSNKKMEYFHGYDLIFKGYAGLIYLVPICIFIIILIVSFMRKSPLQSLRAFAAVWRAIGAGLSGIVIWLMPQLQFLFDDLFYRAGYALGLACAAAVFGEGIYTSLKNLFILRKERPPSSERAYSVSLLRYHYGIAFFSLLLVPAHFYVMRSEIVLPVLIFLIFSLPFVLSQIIAVEGVWRGERWTRRWAVAVFFLALAALALLVVSFF